MRDMAADDQIVEGRGWARGPRGSSLWRIPNATSDLGWLMLGAAFHALRGRIDAWYSPANTLPALLPRPMFVTIHDTNVLGSNAYDRAYATYARRAFRASARRARVVFADSNDARDRLVGDLGVSPDRAVVAYPGIDHGRASDVPPLDARIRPPYALVVAQTEPHKNIARLVEAWDAGVPSGLGLVIAGLPGRDEPRLAATIAASRSRERIVRLPSVDDAMLERLYRDAWCFVFPSLAEGFGLPPLEAMSHGVPTAVARSTSLPEVTAGAAELFDPTSAHAIAAAVRTIAEDTAVRERLRRDGPAVAGRYRWEETASVVWRTIREAMA
jgi:glycosyltransferase involved in cell wall biosynthesis